MKNNLLIHVIPTLGSGGAEILLANTIKLLKGYSHIVVTLSGPYSQLDDLQPYIREHICLDVTEKRHWIPAALRLRQIIKKRKPLLVHAHLQLAGIISKIACPKSTPYFYSLHSPYSHDAFEASSLALKMERITARSYHHLIGVSNFVLEDYQKHVPNSGTGDVLYNFVRTDFFEQLAPPKYQPGRKLRCVSVGTIKDAKNYLYSIRSFTELSDVPITLDIYGSWDDEQILSDINGYIADDKMVNINLMGETDQVASVLSLYDAFIISSKFEGFGIALLEAMAVGLPVFASDIPVFRELINDSIVFFDLTDPKDLSLKLRNRYLGILPEQSSYQERTTLAKKLASPENYTDQLCDIYNKYT